jgi:glycosyltransferase involved in cell wall biosynthesis
VNVVTWTILARRFAGLLCAGAYGWGSTRGRGLLSSWLRTYERCFDRFLVPSEFVRDKLIHSGWEKRKIEVLPHFPSVGKEPAGPPNDDAPILYFGRLSAEKGVGDLIRAVAQLPHVRVKIAGDGPERTNLEGLIVSLQLRNVDFAGHVIGEHVGELIAESCFTVLPSRAYETLGKTILESYAHARAVIASDLGSRREFVVEGETGLLYPVGQVGKLSEQISYLCSRPELAKRMGRAGLELVRRNHSPKDHYQS